MKLVIEFDDAQAQRLQREAARLRVDPSELVRAAVSDLLGRIEDPAFRERWLNDVRAPKDAEGAGVGTSEIVQHAPQRRPPVSAAIDTASA